MQGQKRTDKYMKTPNDKKSADEAFSGYSRKLLNFIRGKVGRFEDAEDILQEVFYQLSRVINTITPIENTSAWLYRVASNKIIDHYKKDKNEVSTDYYDDENDEYIFDEITDMLYGEEATPETETFRALIFDEIKDALNDLPEEQREVFLLTEFQDFSVKEAAQKTNTSVNTVLSRKHYAVKYLRKKLKELYDAL